MQTANGPINPRHTSVRVHGTVKHVQERWDVMLVRVTSRSAVLFEQWVVFWVRDDVDGVYGLLPTTESLYATDVVWYLGASCGCNAHDHNVLARRKSPRNCKQSLSGKSRRLWSCRQGRSFPRGERNARLRSRAMRWLEDASLHLSIVVIPMQLSAKKSKHRTSIFLKNFVEVCWKNITKLQTILSVVKKEALCNYQDHCKHIKGNERD